MIEKLKNNLYFWKNFHFDEPTVSIYVIIVTFFQLIPIDFAYL